MVATCDLVSQWYCQRSGLFLVLFCHCSQIAYILVVTRGLLQPQTSHPMFKAKGRWRDKDFIPVRLCFLFGRLSFFGKLPLSSPYPDVGHRPPRLRQVLFFSFWLCHMVCQISVPLPETESGSQQWKHWVRTIGPPRNSLRWGSVILK